MKHMRIAMSSLMIIAFDPLTAAHAQTKSKPKLSILIKEPSENDLKCGISNETIKTSAILVLRNNGIEFSTDMTYPYLSISFATLPSDDFACTYHLTASILEGEVGKKRNGFSSKYEAVRLCEKGAIARSRKSDMNKNLSDYTEDLLKKCLAEVEY